MNNLVVIAFQRSGSHFPLWFYFIRRGTANTFCIQLGDGANWTSPAFFRLKKTGIWEKITVPIDTMNGVNPLYIKQARVMLAGIPQITAYNISVTIPQAWGNYHRMFQFSSANSGFAICDIKAVSFITF